MKLIKISVLVMLLIFCMANLVFAKSPVDARITLGQMNVKYTEESFLESISNSDAIVVDLFLDAGINVNVKVTEGKYIGITPLLVACAKGDSEIVEKIITKGADINVVQDNTEESPLIMAVSHKNLDVVKILLAHNPDLSLQNSRGKNALDIAVLKGYVEIGEVLKASGLQPSIGTSVTSVQLNDQQINQAIQIGYSAADNKEDIVFNEMDTDKTFGGLLGTDIKSMGRAYFMTQFCAISNEALQAKKHFINLDKDKLEQAAQEFRVAFVFTLPTAMGTQFNVNEWADMSFVILQNDKVIRPIRVSEAKPQITTVSALFSSYHQLAVGFIATFDSAEIDMKKPIEVKSISKASKELTFRFKMNYDWNNHLSKTDEYKW